MNRAVALLTLCLIFNFTAGSIAGADPRVKFPIPEHVIDDSKVMTLTISIPSTLDREKKEILTKPIVEPKRYEHKYFDMDPFPTTFDRDDMRIIQKIAQVGITSSVLESIMDNKMIGNDYEVARTIHFLLSELYRFTPQELIDNNITQGDIQDFKLVMEKFKHSLKTMGVSVNQHYPKLDMLARKLTMKSGEVKVVKITEGEKGETIIHLTLRELGDIERLYPPEIHGTQEINLSGKQKSQPEFMPYQPPERPDNVSDFIVPSSDYYNRLPDF